MSAETWPEDVFARYLTVGGATVDLRDTGPRNDPCGRLYSTTATCGGCGTQLDAFWDTDSYNDRGRPVRISREKATVQAALRAREWAQSHAGQCRAMPAPGGDSG